ncbi:hypothetical protein CSQ93_21710 [Janthinobacterium sp. BJB426]|uniref:hypothetical protein n=1 Tax=Janthinobacterium sp. BJB426 TaxID=2048010 RepID=UPI000C0D2106|nr:hypothetical protein [Janthinobacterium sp. BJB426]PHV25836.1 hypothetical protein CSQ93_21710 [Janthinobacterium sp. BJB426]
MDERGQQGGFFGGWNELFFQQDRRPMHNAFMQLCAAIINIKQTQLAVVQVEPEHTLPTTAPAALMRAQRYFPTLPILLLSPRIGDFSRSYATFNITPLIGHINADEIAWRVCEPPASPEPPF